MSNTEKFQDDSNSGREQKERQFNFEEIAEFEPALLSLVKQLKEKIEKGEYDTLISDDVGGRIPTLLIRKIVKAINPEKKLRTFFIASGKTYYPHPADDPAEYQELLKYLKEKIAPGTKKVLVVTQFINTGRTFMHFLNSLREAGITNIDLAALDAMPHFEREDLLKAMLGDDNLYVGSRDWHHYHDEHDKMSGVRKFKEPYSPHPNRMVDVIAKDGRELTDDDFKEIFGIEKGDYFAVIDKKVKDPERIAEFERRLHEPLTPEEAEEIQKNIVRAREDVDFLARKVVGQVWGKSG